MEEPRVERQTAEQLMADGPARKVSAASDGIPADVKRSIVHEMIDRYYRRLLDEPIPLLGHVAPRECAKSAEGRRKLVAWLKNLENHAAQHDPPDPMAGYDATWLWEELGVAELRK